MLTLSDHVHTVPMKKKAKLGLPDNPTEQQAVEAMLATRPAKRLTVTLALSPKQSAILDALVTVRQRTAAIGTPPKTRAEIALDCFAKGLEAEVGSLPKLPWSEEERRVLEPLLGRKL